MKTEKTIANAGTIRFMNWIEDMMKFKMINTEESAYSGEMGFRSYSSAQQKNREEIRKQRNIHRMLFLKNRQKNLKLGK